MGENGAGKTTLMSILYGLLQPDAGEIVVRGRQVKFASPIDAIAHGLGMVHQSFKLFGHALRLGERGVSRRTPAPACLHRPGRRRDPRCARCPNNTAWFRRRRCDRGAASRRFVVSASKCSRRSIADAHILVLDEPTAVLTQEYQGLFAVMRNLVADGRAIFLFVTAGAARSHGGHRPRYRLA